MPLPDVILLNGASCAGKTSIARMLQERLPEPFLRMAIDDFVPMLPSRYLGHPDGVQFVPQPDGSVPVRLGPMGIRVAEAFHWAVRGATMSGVSVIVDDVMLDRRLLPHWVSVLKDQEVFFVGVHCALAELERRERTRADRAQGHARTTVEIVHVGAHYDLVTDTTATSTESCVDQILMATATRKGPSAFQRLRGGA